MARKLIYEVVLDSAAYTKQIKKVQAETTGFATSLKKTSRETEHLARGAAYGSGAFRSLGRSLAFASGGFLAFQGAAAFIRTSVDAARDAAASQRSLAAQMKTSGESFQANRDQVEKTALSYAKFGFNNDQVTQSLTILERGTGKISAAFKLQGLAADIAAAKGITLAAAATTVAKVFGGQETALRRAVPGLAKNAHGWDLIRLAQAKMFGQAAANTNAQKVFGAALYNTEEIIGTALLPSLNNLLGSMSKYLIKLQQTGKLQKDAAASVTVLSDAWTLASKSVGLYAKVLHGLAGGGNGPRSLLVKTFLQPGFALHEITNMLSGHPPGWKGGAAGAAAAPPGLAGPTGGAAGPGGPTGLTGPLTATPGKPATAAQRNKWFDAMIGHQELAAGLLTSASAQLAAYKKIGAILKAQIAAVDDVTRQQNLKDQALQNAATVAGLQAQIAADLKQKQLDAAQKIKDQIDAARTEKMGWLDFAIERADATKTIKDNLAAYRDKEKYILGLIKADGRTLEHVKDLWEVRKQIKDLNKKNADTDPLAGLFQVGSAKLANILAAGTGLDAAGRRRLGFNIAGAEIQPVHMHVNLDGREIASVVTKHQARSGNRTSHQTSGRRG